MPTWMVKKTDKIIFDSDSGELRTIDGVYIASLEIDSSGSLAVLPGIDTTFCSVSKEIQMAGWDGSEENFDRQVFLSNEEGLLSYQKNRKGQNPGSKIEIEVTRLKGKWLPVLRKSKPSNKEAEDVAERINDLLGFGAE